jgi:hypothetical protein
MGTDVTWSSVLGALQATLPAGAAITGFDAVVGTGAASTATTGTTGSGGAATTAVAPPGTAVTVTLDVSSKHPPDQKAIVAGFAKTPGVLGVDLSSLSSENYPTYTSTTVVFFDDSVFSGRYAGKSR